MEIKMNILYLSLGREYGGTEKVIENLLDSFKNDLKNKITVVAMNNTRFFQVLKLKYSNNSNNNKRYYNIPYSFFLCLYFGI